MKFYILEEDYSGFLKKDKKGPLRIDYATSVTAYKDWLFSCLNQFGRIVPISGRLETTRLKGLLKKPDAIFVSVLFLPEKNYLFRVPHRLLWLSLGSLLLPEHIYNIKYLPSSQVNLVSTQFQLNCLRSYLGSLVPETTVFSNKIDTDFFIPPDCRQRLINRKKQGIKEGQLHIIYAGRWVVTKGICQLIRALDIWPLPNVVLSVVGNIEEESPLFFSSSQHKTFLQFLNQEILRNNQRPWLRLQPAADKKELRNLFWSADLFVNLSTFPTENFGLTPRQAMACGLPVVTTNFCGLRPLADSMPWGGIDTYPTLFGSRFSLSQFRIILKEAIAKRNLLSSQQYHGLVLKECDPRISKDNLEKAVRYLINKPAQTVLNMENIERKVKKRLLGSLDNRIFKYFTDIRKELPPGACVYGDWPPNYTFPVAQAIYSTMSAPPRVENNSRWHGFFRIGFWDKEMALVELGYPGPRIRRYSKKSWNSLIKCVSQFKPDEYVVIPRDKKQIAIVQELVDLGYLVPKDY